MSHVRNFGVRVKTRKGVEEMNIEATSIDDARRRAKPYGRVLRIKKKRAVGTGGKMGYSDRQIFLSRLAAMLASGVGAGEALRLMRTTFRGIIAKTAKRLEERLEQGDSLPDAMDRMGSKIIPQATAAMIKAGSHSGATHEALKGAMTFERTMNQVRKESGKGLIHAALSFLVAAGFIVASVFWFLPAVMESELMQMGGGTQGAMMQNTITFAYAVGWIMGGIGFLFFVLFFMGTVGRKIAPAVIDQIILKIPLYRDLVLAKTNFVAFYGLSLLVKTGVNMEGALGLMSQTTPPGSLRKDFENAKKAVLKGKDWHVAMRTLEPTDRAALGASLDRMQVANAMSAISTQYRDIYAERMASFVPILQGMAAIFLMLAGLIMFGLTILPMLQMSSGILGM